MAWPNLGTSIVLYNAYWAAYIWPGPILASAHSALVGGDTLNALCLVLNFNSISRQKRLTSDHCIETTQKPAIVTVGST